MSLGVNKRYHEDYLWTGWRQVTNTVLNFLAGIVKMKKEV